MARGVNKVIILGNLGQDPETRYLASGAAVTTISVATSESWTDKQSGQKQERTEWHRVVFFNKLAEIAGEYLRKGRKVYIEGALLTRKWQAQDGTDRYTTEIVASEMQMLGSETPPERRQPAHTQHAGHQSSDSAKQFYAPQDEPTQSAMGGGWSDPQSTGAPDGMMSHPDNDPFDNDIPF